MQQKLKTNCLHRKLQTATILLIDMYIWCHIIIHTSLCLWLHPYFILLLWPCPFLWLLLGLVAPLRVPSSECCVSSVEREALNWPRLCQAHSPSPESIQDIYMFCMGWEWDCFMATYRSTGVGMRSSSMEMWVVRSWRDRIECTLW